MFHRRDSWPPRPLQWPLSHLMLAIALSAAGLGLSRLSLPMLLLLSFSAVLSLGPLFLARKGFKLVDIVAVLAIALVTIGFLLPVMVQTRIRTAGQRTFPIRVPDNLHSFLFGDR